jgi:hypothetical protein
VLACGVRKDIWGGGNQAMATKIAKRTKGKNVLRKNKALWKLYGPGKKWLNASLLKVIYVGADREKIAIFRVR